MSDQGEVVVDLKLSTPFLKVGTVKLSSIVTDENSGNAKTTDDGLSNELSNDLLSYLGS